MGIDSITNGITGTIAANPVASTLGAAGAGIALGVGATAVVGAVKRRKTKRRKSRNSRKRNNRNRKVRRSKRKTPHTAGKRKDRSHKRIRYTKNGQPYILLRNGRARFISMRSAKISHKRKGGKY